MFEQAITLRAVTVIMAVVVGLTFLFGFGNVWILALRLGVPTWVAPLVAPAVDLSVLGLLLGTRYLALHGASREQLRPARQLLVFSSVMTLALNVADPLITDQVGKAAFDAVGPLLLIGWAEVGPGLLQAISGVRTVAAPSVEQAAAETASPWVGASDPEVVEAGLLVQEHAERPGPESVPQDDLLESARREDAWHWRTYQRPISAETLRKRLRIGAARSRMLVAVVRADNGDRLTDRDGEVAAQRAVTPDSSGCHE
ncbi:SpdA protein [Streptomyces sp. RB6PN25]|uniref:SpdA protein n=1 Tax=Streptomyces humicola TaxID=2953240 RepID=A0ABT1PTA3_9ACTN|nr:SpdA protein [Streptomyces humicola]MCQ4080908.1 SpdA protein [Streptomyces humicola]